MKRLIITFATSTMLSTAVVAQDMRSFTDDLGRNVNHPTKPERIAALHDIELTVPLLELGLLLWPAMAAPAPLDRQ